MTMTAQTKRYLSVAETAVLIRQALAREFPGVKFSVRSKSYSGGASVHVSWTDGPTAKMVDKVAGEFSGASFDGMIDLKSYHASEFNGELVHFGADFVFTRREYTDARICPCGSHHSRAQLLAEMAENEDSAYPSTTTACRGCNAHYYNGATDTFEKYG